MTSARVVTGDVLANAESDYILYVKNETIRSKV